jgi:hypothetical protein
LHVLRSILTSLYSCLIITSCFSFEDFKPQFYMHFLVPLDVLTLRSSHPSWFNHPNSFTWRVRIWKFLVMWCQFFYYFLCLSSKFSPLQLLQQRAICTDLGWYPYGIAWYVGPPDHQIWVSGYPHNAPKERDREELLACNRQHI